MRPPEYERTNVLAPDARLDIGFLDQLETAQTHHADQPVAREIPAVLERLVMLGAQHMGGIAEDRQREKYPLSDMAEQPAEIRYVLKHVPQRDRIEPRCIRIDEQTAPLEPLDADRADVIAEGVEPPCEPRLDERARADANIDQFATIMPADEVAARRHEPAADLGFGIAREIVEIVLVIRFDPALHRVVADAEFGKPGQAAVGQAAEQRSPVSLVQSVNCW